MNLIHEQDALLGEWSFSERVETIEIGVGSLLASARQGRESFDVDDPEVGPFGLGEQLRERGLADLARATDDQRLASGGSRTCMTKVAHPRRPIVSCGS
ncbi:MAG: hypothetical protein F4Z28_05735 [Gammaproteobacteria bacterium]|nr:hypothetical protein [Gammaproteobacteria bacterium]